MAQLHPQHAPPKLATHGNGTSSLGWSWAWEAGAEAVRVAEAADGIAGMSSPSSPSKFWAHGLPGDTVGVKSILTRRWWYMLFQRKCSRVAGDASPISSALLLAPWRITSSMRHSGTSGSKTCFSSQSCLASEAWPVPVGTLTSWTWLLSGSRSCPARGCNMHLLAQRQGGEWHCALRSHSCRSRLSPLRAHRKYIRLLLLLSQQLCLEGLQNRESTKTACLYCSKSKGLFLGRGYVLFSPAAIAWAILPCVYKTFSDTKETKTTTYLYRYI